MTLPPGVCVARATRSYRVAGEVENVSRLTVDPIDRVRAKRFVVREHYSGTFSGRVSVGLFADPPRRGRRFRAEQRRGRSSQRPARVSGHPLAVRPARGSPRTRRRGSSRGLPSSPPRARRRCAVVSYSDPVLRRSLGRVPRPARSRRDDLSGFNGRYLGRSGAERNDRARRDDRRPPRPLKVERRAGDAHVVDRLVARSAHPVRSRTRAPTSLARSRTVRPRRVRHPGKHVYAELGRLYAREAQSPTPKGVQ